MTKTLTRPRDSVAETNVPSVGETATDDSSSPLRPRPRGSYRTAVGPRSAAPRTARHIRVLTAPELGALGLPQPDEDAAMAAALVLIKLR